MVGDAHNGGIVAWLGPNYGYIIPANINYATSFGCEDQFFNLDRTNGFENTRLILINCYGSPPNAAVYADNLTIDGYDDWWLPSESEMKQIALNKDYLPSLPQRNFWSSNVTSTAVITVSTEEKVIKGAYTPKGENLIFVCPIRRFGYE